MATLSALSIVVKQDVPYLVQLAREEVDKARLEMERAQMRAEDTYEFQRVYSIGYACEAKMHRLWKGIRRVEFDLQDGIEVANNYHDLKKSVVCALSRTEDILEEADEVYHNAKATWRNNFRG